MERTLRSLLALVAVTLAGIALQGCLAHGAKMDHQSYDRPTVGGGQGDERSVAEIRKTFDGLVEAANRRDAEALGRFFDAGVTVIDMGGRTVGWESYRAKVLPAQFDLVPAGAAAHSVSALAITAHGDMGWATYRFQMDASTKQGRQKVFGFGTAVFQREQGDWKVVALQTAGRPLREGETLDWAAIDGMK